MWPIYYDRTITFQPTIPKYPTLKPTWRLDDVTLPDDYSDDISFTKEVYIPVNSSRETRHVTVHYQTLTKGADLQLVLKVRGIDGNFPLKVTLSYKFDDNGPWVLFREVDLFITGQGIDGDKAFQDYIACLDHYRKTFTRYMAVHKPIAPGSPLEDVIRFEGNLTSLTRILTQGTRED